MTDPSVPGLVPKRAAMLVVGDRIPESQLIYKFNKGPAEVVFLADEPEDSHTFIAYRYPNRRHESMTVRSEAVLDVFPADTGLGYSRADDGETTQNLSGRVPPQYGAVVNEGGHAAVSIGGALIEIDPPWSPETGFFEPGRVPELIGDDLRAPKSRCDCIAYQGDHNCAAMDGCRCSEVFPTSAPCTCGHDFEDHESDEHGTGGRCQARIDGQSF